MSSTSPASPVLDRLAIGASAACLAHCLLLPLLIAALPAASRMIELPETFHVYAFAAAVSISALAMRAGYLRHGLRLPAALGLTGLALLGTGALAGLEGLPEVGATLAGSTILTMAHLRNWQLSSSRTAAMPSV